MLGAAAAGAVVVGLQQSVKAALDAEKSQARLQQAFRNAHLSMTTYEKGLGRTEKAARGLGFGDNEVRDSLGSLMTATGNYNKALELLSTAQDVSRFKHVGLTDATKMLIGATTGSQRATKALGITIMPVTTHVDALKKHVKELNDAHKGLKLSVDKTDLAHAKMLDKMATGESVIAAVTAKTKGQADAYGKTAAGAIDKFRAEFEHLKAELGKGLLPILSGATTRMTGFIQSVGTRMPEIRAQFGGLATAVGSVGKSLLNIGTSRGGQTALAGLATTFVSSGVVGEVGSFIDLLKTMNPVLIAGGVAAGIFGAAMFAITTSTSGLTLELTKAKQAINNLKDAQNSAVQAGQDVTAARHQATAAEIAHGQAVKNTALALKTYGRTSDEYKQALSNEHLAADQVVQSHINLKNAHQGARRAAVDVTSASKSQAAALETLRKRGDELAAASVTGLRGYQVRAQEARKAATGFSSALAAGAASTYARAIGNITRAMGGTRGEALRAQDAVLALARALGHLPTLRQVNIIVTEQRRSSALGKLPRTGRGGGGVTTRQHGGFVPGGTGEPVPVLAHAGEIILNPDQQDVLGGPHFLSQLFGFTGSEGPGFASGGRVKKRPKHRAPHLPASIREAEARAAGTKTVDDDIRAVTSEQRWINTELKRKDLTKSERAALRVRKIRVANRLASLGARRTKAREKDYSILPASIQYRISKSKLGHTITRHGMTFDTGPDLQAQLVALREAEAYLEQQLGRRGLTFTQKAAIIDALVGIRSEIKSVQDEINASYQETIPEDTATAEPDPDLAAQLAQANQRGAAATRAAELANAFVATGVFAGPGAAGGVGGGGGAPVFVFQSAWPPSPEILRQVGAGASEGIGMQGYRPATNAALGL